MKMLLAIVFCVGPWLGWSWALVHKDAKYTNRWVVNIEGGEVSAKKVARDLGYSFRGQIGSFKDHYEFVREDHPKVSLQDGGQITRNLQNHNEVKWAKQQTVSRNVYKESNEEADQDELVKYMRGEARGLEGCKLAHVFSCIKFPTKFKKLLAKLNQGDISKLGTFPTFPAPHSQLNNYKGVTKNIKLLSKKISAYALEYNDELWRKQWYMQDYRTSDLPVMDLNIIPVHKMKITGNGVTVAVVDTAIHISHPDLQRNIDIDKSFDMCVGLPLAEVLKTGPYPGAKHGTECAGVIAMEENNNLCGVGVAFNAKIAAINKDCDKDETDEDHAKALVQNLEMVDIYSFSWGPDDDPQFVCVLDKLSDSAYRRGITEGRKGKGVIYVHSSGNGGRFGDNCATDCAVNQPHVIAISSANQFGKRSDFAERCTAIFAVTYSGTWFTGVGDGLEGNVATLPGSGCTTRFAGTSSSCPIASGIIALTLEANPELTYRDVMHIIARSAEVAPLADNPGSWYMNGQGFWVSNDFGFGLMNAENMVKLALNWEPVLERHICIVTIQLNKPESLSLDRTVKVPFTTDACEQSPSDVVRYLEHLEVESVVQYPCRGDIELFITSPAGTRSAILEPRMKDLDKDGLEGWGIMSVHNWGENPSGTWIIEVKINNMKRAKDVVGLVKEFTVAFYGMARRPVRLEERRTYAAFRLPEGQNEWGEVEQN